jgi:aspartyl-tRNA(Asn)/glutamyl-tRNA(Gln) amidotransferase subunit A
MASKITSIQKDLLDKKYSAVELVEKYLNKIDQKNDELNIYLTITGENALKEAALVDEKIGNLGEKAFVDSPLLGIPMAYKDIFMTKGIRTTAGSKVLENYIAQYSATSLLRLEKAGAVGLGKLNLDAWAHGSSGENSDFGPTKNPWNPEFVPGGSSSGSAAAVASDMAVATMATDTCGSIRLPANYCGVVGLKPTYGSVSRWGVISMASSLDSIGHITSSVEDSEKIFNVTSGTDKKDATLVQKNSLDSKNSYKIGIPKEFFEGGLDPEIAKNIEDVISYYKKQGVEFTEISLPHTKYGIEVYYIIQPAEVSSNLARFDGIRFGEGRDSFGAEAKRRIMMGTYVLSAGYYDAYYLKAMKVRTIIKNEVDKAFENVDAIIAPVAPTPPFKIGEKVDDPVKMYLTDIYAATANLSGIPSIAVPSGKTASGLPLGFQLMGPRFGEQILFNLGKLWEISGN